MGVRAYESMSAGRVEKCLRWMRAIWIWTLRRIHYISTLFIVIVIVIIKNRPLLHTNNK